MLGFVPRCRAPRLLCAGPAGGSWPAAPLAPPGPLRAAAAPSITALLRPTRRFEARPAPGGSANWASLAAGPDAGRRCPSQGDTASCWAGSPATRSPRSSDAEREPRGAGPLPKVAARPGEVARSRHQEAGRHSAIPLAAGNGPVPTGKGPLGLGLWPSCVHREPLSHGTHQKSEEQVASGWNWGPPRWLGASVDLPGEREAVRGMEAGPGEALLGRTVPLFGQTRGDLWSRRNGAPGWPWPSRGG